MVNVAKRILIISVVLLALPISLVLTPIALIVAVMFDLIQGFRQFPLARLWIYGVVFLIHEWYAISARLVILIGRGLRLYNKRPLIMALWSGSLLRWADRILGIHLEYPKDKPLPHGRLIFLSRHSSAVDAIIPAWLVNGPLGRPVHYVLKRELSWVPSINLFVPVLGNYFVQRSADTTRELTEIGELAADAIANSALVIFPEGTYGTDHNRQRIRKSLERRGETAALQVANELEHVLPPKFGGVGALLTNRPDANVVVFGHSGLESMVGLASIRRSIPPEAPIVLDWWDIPRDRVPTDEAGQEQWLYDEWRVLDAWVGNFSTDKQSEFGPADRLD